MPNRVARAFTLIEILVVVVILGVLSAIVVPQFSSTTEETERIGAKSQLVKLRNALAVYYVRNSNAYPSVAPGPGTWGELISADYVKEPPVNLWVGRTSGGVIVFGNGPDAGYQNTHGWIYDPDPTLPPHQKLWAGSFDPADEPYARP